MTSSSTFIINSVSGHSEYVVIVGKDPAAVSTSVVPNEWLPITVTVAGQPATTPAVAVFWDSALNQVRWGITRSIEGSPTPTTIDSIIKLTSNVAASTSPASSASSASLASSVSSASPSSSISATQTSLSSTSTSILPSGSSVPQKDNLSKGDIAGIVVGSIIAVALFVGLVLLFLWRRRRVPETKYSKTNTYSAEPQEKGFAAQTVPLPGQEPTNADPTGGLPQPLEDKAISGDVSKISNAIKNHVQSYYHNNRINPNLIDQSDLHTLGSNLPISVETLTTMMSNATTREVALRFIIAWVIVSKLQPSEDPTKSLLPTEIALSLQTIDTGNGNQQAQYSRLARWRILTAESLQSSYVRNPFTPSDSRHEAIQTTLATLDSVLQPYADPRMNNEERKRNLEELLKRAALFAFTLFSQPSVWEFEWQDHSVASGELCIFPALVQVVDENGQPISPPRPFSEAVIRRLDA
ncbi:cell wall integrity and stress response component [Pyrenophora seminiperda CCB06]|uniref:Cell wall integrity and stress response component n=1 Tax=Pyrenophora seminiperda CCB06 TaxID=1302712 RepID=A0A3M7M0S3_9PLEO|nr:cell wall integrity and stress response component [Pyrenophora seminiperda CCB06]